MASRGRSARYMYMYDVETGYTGETRERAEQEWKPQKENGDNCARGNARGSSPYSGLKPATASAKLLTLRCAHMTRSAARDAHPASLIPRAPPLRLLLILVWIRWLCMYVYVYIYQCPYVCVCVYSTMARTLSLEIWLIQRRSLHMSIDPFFFSFNIRQISIFREKNLRNEK